MTKCPLTRGVRLGEVSVSGGSTAIHNGLKIEKKDFKCGKTCQKQTKKCNKEIEFNFPRSIVLILPGNSRLLNCRSLATFITVEKMSCLLHCLWKFDLACVVKATPCNEYVFELSACLFTIFRNLNDVFGQCSEYFVNAPRACWPMDFIFGVCASYFGHRTGNEIF